MCDSEPSSMFIVPKEGWFIDLRGGIQDTAVYHNGQRVNGIKRIQITVDADTFQKKTEITFFQGEGIVLYPEETTNVKYTPKK